ncbi:MAG: hypothetical protein HY205_06850 [Nitrospirae bacterium]|nr:hypothetical protein [Nitrospirota bacterium]
MNRQSWKRVGSALITIAFFVVAVPVFAQEQKDGGPKPMLEERHKQEPAPQEEEGAGQLIRKEEPATHLCAGCLSAIYSEGSKGTITPYGRVELDAIYSSRNNNPLDPGQFNGYATAAGKGNNASSTLNPRYSVFGVRADRTDGKHSLTGVVEVDFYGQTDNAGNIPPRLRLANVRYTSGKTSLTAGCIRT